MNRPIEIDYKFLIYLFIYRFVYLWSEKQTHYISSRIASFLIILGPPISLFHCYKITADFFFQ